MSDNAAPLVTWPKTKRLHHRMIGSAAICLLFAISPLGCTLQDHNFHTVVAGQVYRSAQMNGKDLARCIKKYKIQSVLNLRAENPTAGWYQTEITTATKLNIVHYDRYLDAGNALTLDQMDDLVNLLRQAPKPILVHCRGGADRSGLVSALYCFAIDGQTAKQADRQLTIWYGHVPLLQPNVIAMDDSYWHYISNHVSSLKSAENTTIVASQ